MTDISEIRQRIPGMRCIPGCVACCNHVPWSKVEYERMIRRYPKNAKPYNIHSLKCPFITEDGCSIYEERPITCRMFGVSEGLECPRGAIAAEMLNEQQAASIYVEYTILFKEEKSCRKP